MLIGDVHLCFQGKTRVIDVDRGWVFSCPLVFSGKDESYRC